MPLVINGLGADTQTDRQTDTYRHANQSNFKKPGMRVRGLWPRTWFKNTDAKSLKCSQNPDYWEQVRNICVPVIKGLGQ